MPPSPKPRPNGRLAMLIGAPAATLLLATLAGWEGLELRPYRDVAGILTVCYGDTNNVEQRRYTQAECEARLEEQARRHVEPVLACVPQLRGRPNQTVAAASLAYNIGVGGFCQSSVARHFRAGQWRAGCERMMVFNKARINGRLVPVRGLTNRRSAERAICLRGL
jgi:lysozyme